MILSKPLPLNLFFLPVILFIGFVTSYEDFKIHKIRNKWVICGLLYSFLIYLFIWFLSKINLMSSYPLLNFDKWCVNLIISSLVAYALWNFKMWGAGDAKLFIAYAALIPIGQYSKLYFHAYFASLLLLCAIFIPATVYLLLKSIFYFIRRLSFKELKEKSRKLAREKLTRAKILEMAKVVFGFFVFFLIFKILRGVLSDLFQRVMPDQNIMLLISLLVFKQLAKFFKKYIAILTVVLIILLIYTMSRLTYSWGQFLFDTLNMFIKSIYLMILFPLVKKIIDLYNQEVAQGFSPFAHWMFLGALLSWFGLFKF